MSSAALNSVYKTAIVAVEEAAVVGGATNPTGDLVAADATINVSVKVMTQTPFIAGNVYVLRDDSFNFVTQAPNCERIQIASISAASATANGDGVGWTYAATLHILGWTSTGYSGGIANGYKQTNSPTILIPGVEMAIQSSDFNCRFKTLTDAPKTDFDDEASRFASGDEGRDLSLAGARSGEISFTEKLSWAGLTAGAPNVPTYNKLLRTMGHITIKRFALSVTLGETYSHIANLLTYLAAQGVNIGMTFYSADGNDTTADAALAFAKGSGVSAGDAFVITGITYSGSTITTGTIKYAKTSNAGIVTGIEFVPLTHANEVTATIWILAPENGMAPTQTIYRYVGAHGGNGSNTGAAKVGDAYMLTGKYSAAYVGTSDISSAYARVLTAPNTTTAEVLLSNSCTAPAIYGTAVIPSNYTTATLLISGTPLTIGARFYTSDGSDTGSGALLTAKQVVLPNATSVAIGDAFTVLTISTIGYVVGTKTLEISQFNLDMGGVVSSHMDQSTTTGNAYYKTDDRDPKVTINPYHVRKSLDDTDFLCTNQVAGPLAIASALSTPHITHIIPRAQMLSPALASREGYVNTNRTYRCLRNDIGAGASDTALPLQAMYSILIGSRS